MPTAPSLRDHRTHVLEARTRRQLDSTLALTVRADGTIIYDESLSAALTADLEGPIGVRSDNGNYRFTLSAANRRSR